MTDIHGQTTGRRSKKRTKEGQRKGRGPWEQKPLEEGELGFSSPVKKGRCKMRTRRSPVEWWGWGGRDVPKKEKIQKTTSENLKGKSNH